MIYSINHVIKDFETCLKKGNPFSIIRPGDGALKLFRVEQKKDYVGGVKKLRQQGIPETWMAKTIEVFRDACNEANYITSFQPYFDDPKMFPRRMSPGTKKLVRNWEKVYEQIGITNKNFFGPNVGFGLFSTEYRNAIDILKGKDICIINNFKKPQKRLHKTLGSKVHMLQIPGEYKKHHKLYDRTMENIKDMCKEVDVFLVGAGDLGRGYSMQVKRCGKIALDIGNVFTCWDNPGKKPEYLRKHMIMNKDLTFTFSGRRVI